MPIKIKNRVFLVFTIAFLFTGNSCKKCKSCYSACFICTENAKTVRYCSKDFKSQIDWINFRDTLSNRTCYSTESTAVRFSSCDVASTGGASCK